MSHAYAENPPWPQRHTSKMHRMSKHDRRRQQVAQAMALRHMARGGPFGPGAPFGPGGPPPFPGRGRGRKRRGDVRAALLMALAEEPRNGYQLMQVIEERSGGRWRPSPGSVYPALAQLEDEGLIRSVEIDDAKAFEITDQGREHLDERHSSTPPWEFANEPGTEAFTELIALTQQIHLAAVQVAQAGDDPQLDRAASILKEARRSLYRILAEEEDTEEASPDA